MSKQRKDNHLQIGLQQVPQKSQFDQIPFVHNNLSNLKLSQIDLTANFMGYEVSVPFYINAITGGSDKAYEINDFLSRLANHFQIPMMVGSQSITFNDETTINSFSIVRKNMPTGIVIANLNANASVQMATNAIKQIEADGLAIHLNLIQELVMSEGDRDFGSWLENLVKLKKEIKHPVLVKEVGFGLSYPTIETLTQNGFKYLDISGAGGTNFAQIELLRSNKTDYFYEKLGLKTVDLLLELRDHKLETNIYASGGINDELDVVKSLMLGAKMVGQSKFFLDLTKLEYSMAVDRLANFIINIKKLFLMLGVKNLAELHLLGTRIKL